MRVNFLLDWESTDKMYRYENLSWDY